MNVIARIVGIAGPLQGATFQVTGEEASIGRATSNKIVMDDSLISRRHCAIAAEAGRLKIRDLDSRNGIFVNGVAVKERWLEHLDQIRVGHSTFVFLLGEVDTTPAQIDEELWFARSGTELRPDDATYLRAPKTGAELPANERTVRDLNTLARISVALSSLQKTDAIQQKLLDALLEVVPAEHGAVILVGSCCEEFASVLSRHRLAGAQGPVKISRTVTLRAMRERVALLSNEILRDKAFSSSESLKGIQARSVLAVPLVVSGKTLGAIYLDTTDAKVKFDQIHLQLVTAIASTAAVALESAQHTETLENEAQRLQAEIDVGHSMVGESPRLQEVYEFVAKVAPADSTVLLCGESGTGKELVARAIHRQSPRRSKAFVAINCAALTETLLESELFGHEKGAFTGAAGQKKGRLEVADGGTVFLDEVAELAPLIQGKLLRVLQEREFERVGGTRPIKVDVRLIAATNEDLHAAVQAERFREDLFYRLNVVSIMLPPLRERREDILLLANYFAAKHSSQSKRQVTGISAEAQAYLMNYDWPGNVRELENAIERAVVLGSTDSILPEDLPDSVLEAQPLSSAPITKYHEGVRGAKKQLILNAMEQTGGNYTEAAKLLGVRPTYLHRLMRNMNLKAAARK